MSGRLADYAQAERAAYRCLIDYGTGRLPIDVMRLLKLAGRARVLSYADVCEEFLNKVSGDAFTIKYDDKGVKTFILFERGHAFAPRRRFSLAHELGHILLGHESDSAGFEKEANAFAAALLCPRPILSLMGNVDVRDISSAFGISFEAAVYAAKNANAPERADSQICQKLIERFAAAPNKRIDEYIDIEYLPKFYKSRLSNVKDIHISAARRMASGEKKPPLFCRDRIIDAALERREWLVEAMCDY